MWWRPGLDEEEPAPPRTVELVPRRRPSLPPSTLTPKPQQQPSDPRRWRFPGAIFSYPILRQKGEPILDEEPPARGPHAPVMPDLSATEEDEDTGSGEMEILPERKPEENPRRRRAVAALRSLHRKMAHT